MTDALKAMVEAMVTEFERQGSENIFWVGDGDGGPETIALDGRSFDLEKVARAGLAAIRDTDESTAYFGSWAVGPGGHPAKKRELAKAFAAMIDAIAKDEI